jgi:hypothetical protein
MMVIDLIIGFGDDSVFNPPSLLFDGSGFPRFLSSFFNQFPSPAFHYFLSSPSLVQSSSFSQLLPNRMRGAPPAGDRLPNRMRGPASRLPNRINGALDGTRLPKRMRGFDKAT